MTRPSIWKNVPEQTTPGGVAPIDALIGPFLFGVAAFTLIFISGQYLFKLTTMVAKGASLADVIELLALRMVPLAIVTFPMATLLATHDLHAAVESLSMPLLLLHAEGDELRRASLRYASLTGRGPDEPLPFDGLNPNDLDRVLRWNFPDLQVRARRLVEVPHPFVRVAPLRELGAEAEPRCKPRPTRSSVRGSKLSPFVPKAWNRRA